MLVIFIKYGIISTYNIVAPTFCLYITSCHIISYQFKVKSHINSNLILNLSVLVSPCGTVHLSVSHQGHSSEQKTWLFPSCHHPKTKSFTHWFILIQSQWLTYFFQGKYLIFQGLKLLRLPQPYSVQYTFSHYTKHTQQHERGNMLCRHCMRWATPHNLKVWKAQQTFIRGLTLG